jgi:hypothetical protein
MNYKQLIAKAWDFTLSNKKLVTYYAFWPAIFAIASTMLILTFQSTSLLTKAGRADFHLYQDIIGFIKNLFQTNPNMFWGLVASGIFIFVLELFLPIFCEGASIQIIAKKYKGEPVKLTSGIKYGWLNFVKLTEYHAILFAFSSFTILRVAGYIYIYLTPDALKLFSPFLILLFFIGLIFSFLFTYAENFIIIDGEDIFTSLKKSSALVLENLKETVLIFFLLVLIGLRILLNLVIVVLVPILFSYIVSVLTALNLMQYKVTLIFIITALLLYFIGKLGGALRIFTQAVWTFTFLELKDRE